MADIYLYNQLEREGPAGIDLLPECMITTSTHDSPLKNNINVLRTFRDNYLLKNDAGRIFVDFYYTYNPPIAYWISRHESIKAVFRSLLVPMIVIMQLFI